MRTILLVLLSLGIMSFIQTDKNKSAGCEDYLNDIKIELNKQWPENRTVNLIFHGHSLPAGYFKTPIVNTFGSYPYILLKKMKDQYPYAVINIINTSIGGENSLSGSKRFKKDALLHNADVIFIDYALNDRKLGLEKAKSSWESMISAALKKNVKVILLTPTPDMRINLLEPDNGLEQHAKQIRELAKKYDVGLVDAYEIFHSRAIAGDSIATYMSHINHLNEKGNALVADEIMRFFR